MITEIEFSTIVKNLEPRWGLTTATFLPIAAQEQIKKLQIKLFNEFDNCDTPPKHNGSEYFYFYEKENLHCTHFTLTRSDPCSPVQKTNLLKNGSEIGDLHRTLSKITETVQPFDGTLNKFILNKTGNELILLGKCLNPQNNQNRIELLNKLNNELPNHIKLSPRKHDLDESRFLDLHCCIGYIKRPNKIDIRAVNNFIENLEINSITFNMDDIDLVHHKYRSLRFPQQGIVHYKFGKKTEMSIDEFSQNIDLL